MKIKIVILIMLFHPIVSKALTKKEAFENLQASAKWNLTKTLQDESNQKALEAESEFRPHVQVALKQLVARINPIQYGSNNQVEVIDTVGFGSSSIQMEWAIANPVAAAQILMTKAQAKVSGHQAREYQNDLTALMLLSYLNVQKLERQLATTEVSLKKSNLIFKLATSKRKIGAGIPLEVARAKGLVGLDQVKKMVALTKLLKSKHDLEKLLDIQKLPSELEKLNPQIVGTLDSHSYMSAAFETRADLKSAEALRDSSILLKQQSSSWFLPKVALFAEAGTVQPTFLGLPAKTLNGAVGISFMIPLESGGLITAKRREAQIANYRAEINLKEKKQEILLQVKEALESVAAAEEALTVARNYIGTSTEEANIAEKRFFSGMSNILDLSSAHTNRAIADDTLTESEFNFEAARINYYRVLGDFKDYF